MKATQKSLKDWSSQNWRTKSGKREATKAGKQFAKQPKKIAEKIKGFR